VPNQLLEPVCQDVARHPESCLEILETPHAQEAIPQNKQAPAVADDGHSSGDRTLLLFQRVPLHADLHTLSL
jgi:hypothetical protein